MPLVHNTPVFSVDNAKIYPLTVDTSATLTYGTGVPVSGIRTTGFSPDIMAKELFGDNSVIARGAKTRQIKFQLEFAKWDLDVLKVILGTGAIIDAGTTPSQTSIFTLLGADQPGYFKLEYRSLGVDLGNGNLSSVNISLAKCKIETADQPVVMEDYGIPKFTASAVATTKTPSSFATITYNETAAALT